LKSDLFKDHNLYPYSGPILEHFRDHFDGVFIALMPFTDKDLITEELPIHKILQEVKPISWKTILKEGEFTDFAEVNKALKSINSVYEPALEREDLEERLYDLCEAQKIIEPIDGEYDPFSKVAIYKALRLLGKSTAVLMDEFYEGTSVIDLEKLSETEYAELILPETYYIFSEDKEILFTLDWESCYFLIASSTEHLNNIIRADLFEGFLCNDRTSHQWEFGHDELVQIEKRSVTSRLLNKITTGFLVYSFSIVTATLLYWFYYRYGIDYISEDHWHFRQFVFDYAVREIIILTQVITVIFGLIASWYDKKYRKAYLLVGLIILEFVLIGQLQIYKGP
jgi:hypothetical protein